MNIHKLFALICAGMMSVGMTGCGSEKGPVTYAPTSENVKALGRTMLTDDDMLWLAFSGSGAEFTFNGTKAEVVIAGDDNAEKPDNEDNQARIAIYVNGERVVDDMIDHAEETYTVFESETPAECDVKIVKLSETANSTCAVKSVTVDAEEGIKPAEKKAHFIEFVGDSITCGYGVDDEVKEHHFSTTTEDVTKTYAYKTAEKLDADYSMVSISGYGIISGYSDGKKKVAEQQLPKYYDKLGNSYGTFGGKRVSGQAWDFTGYTPDAIVVNLGTNDASYTKNKEDRVQDYVDSYVEFLKKLRTNNPDAQIFCTLGIMGQDLYPAVEQAVQNYSEETGDTKVTAMAFDIQSQSDGYAADWHPTEATHEKASEKLVSEIKSVMGW